MIKANVGIPHSSNLRKTSWPSFPIATAWERSVRNESAERSAPAAKINGLPITAIAAGGFHTVALRLDGTVVAWGAGKTLTGHPNYGQSIVPPGLSGVIAISAGLYHTVALKNDGTVVAWGAGKNSSTKIEEK